MPRPISTPCRLQLIPADKVARFAVLHQTAVIQYYPSDVVNLDLTPGSFKLSDQPADGSIYTKKHSFRVPASGIDQQSQLDELTHKPVIALYLDERGRQRVSGSPFYPLQLSVQPSGGTYACTLAGKCVTMDLFVSPD